MAKDILLYSPIWEYTALYFFEQIKEALEGDPEAELLLRINCDGGSPELGWGLICKTQEMENLQIQVDGKAHSMAFMMLCYVPGARAVDSAQFVMHRAAYPRWFETDESFPESIQAQSLTKMNKDLEKAFRASADVEAFENLPQLKEKNITVKSIFSMEDRIEVLLSAADMKKIGLIKDIVKITPAKKSKIAALSTELNKQFSSFDQFKAAAERVEETKEDSNTDNMTLEELKSKHPDIYAQAVKAAKDEGTEEEKERVAAWMEFADVDAEAVKKGIESGKAMTMKDIAAFTRKGLSAEALKKHEQDSPPDTPTAEAETKAKTEKEKELEDFDKKIEAELKNHKWEI